MRRDFPPDSQAPFSNRVDVSYGLAAGVESARIGVAFVIAAWRGKKIADLNFCALEPRAAKR
jgi:hypothetical protein